MVDKFVFGVISWFVIGGVAILVGLLGIFHVIFHDAAPGVILVIGGVVALIPSVIAVIRGRPENFR